MGDKPVCAVVGVGPGNGAAMARRFAGAYRVALLARGTGLSEELGRELDGARAFACDVADATSVAGAFDAIDAEMGAPEVVVYNAGSGVWGPFDQVSPEDFETCWRVNALGLFLVARRTAPAMKAAGQGAIVVIGATASRRGMPRTSAFAPAKAAQKSLTESLARTLWPSGVHVSLVVVDGVIDTPRAREYMRDKPDSFFLKPPDIAEVVWNLAHQPRSAWSFEVEARPFGETW
jgi:NAD(P)-dependent dehydrogenase (short-subunit alcohol dehydrogenase family)